MVQQHKLFTVKQIALFNDTSVPDGSTLGSLEARRMRVAKRILGRIGADVNISTSFFIEMGCHTFIGDNVYLNREYGWIHVPGHS